MVTALENMYATFSINGKLISFVTEFVSIGAAGDVALLILKPVTAMFAADEICILPLATSPKTGTNLTMMGVKHDRDKFLHVPDEAGYRLAGSGRIVKLHGKLLETIYSPEQYTGFINAPSFTRDIPIGAGFSGSPILSFQPLSQCEPHMQPLHGLAVCGIASSELPGSYSTCTHIYSAFNLETEPGGETVLDWVKKGKIRWAGKPPHLIRMRELQSAR